MRFAGKVWKLLVGIKDGLVLLFMLGFFGLLYAALSARPTVGSGENGALLLDLDGPIVEQPAQATPTEVLGGGGPGRQYRLRDVVKAIEAAKDDDRIEAIALDLDIFAGGGQSTLQQVGEALAEVRKSGKPVLAYATAYDDDSYQLAANASEVWLNPMGAVLVAGPGGTGLFFKGLMDKLGITANVYRVGTYKAAVEPFTRSDMSPEAKEALQAVADGLWETWQQSVRQARPKAQLAAYVGDPGARIAASGGDMARAALTMGFVDKIGDRAEFGRRVAEIAGTRDDAVPEDFRTIDYEPWVAVNPASEDGGEIGILTVAGDIVDGEAGLGTAGAETIVEALEEGLRGGNLKALVVRVDSGGGSALASERIRRAVLGAKAKGIPVVVSMGSVAASGGYWVATAGDTIFAEPSTITGSIGVFGILPSFEGSMAKLGIGADGVKTTPLSGEPDLLRGPGPEADRLLQMSVESIYRQFLDLVSKARKLPVERVDQIAQGRIWDGGTARQLGLVDRFGGLDDAIAEAAKRAKIDADDVDVTWLEPKPGFMDELLMSLAEDDSQAGRDAFGRMQARPRAMLVRALAQAEQMLDGPAIQARCLECPPSELAPARGSASPWLVAWLGQMLPG